MRKVYLIIAAVAAVMVVSCNKEVKENNEAGQRVIKTFTCSIESDADTKVAIPDDGKAVWEVGDEIFIHGKVISESVTHTLTAGEISADGKKATFSVDLTGVEAYDPDSYYACYPASAVSYFSSSSKTYYYGEFNDTNKPLMAAYLDGSTFKFYNLCGVLTFKVSGDFDEYIFTGNNNEDLGYGQYQVKINSEDRNYARTTNNPVKSLRAPVTSDGTFINKVCFPNGVNLTKGFTILLLKDGDIVKQVSTKETYSVNIARGKLLPLGDVTGKLKNYDVPTHNSSIAIASATDLGATATANCYIVDGSNAANKDKIFKFKAVKGNSATALSQVESAEIVWETYNTAGEVTANSVIADVDYDLQLGEDPYIVFQMPSTLHAGNALIAAKNGGGSIIWSWHIWVPATTVSDISGATDFCGYDKIQDRNLGALNVMPATGDAVPTAMGLYYQWGRKDPFPSNSAFSGSTPITLKGTEMSTHSGLITTAYSVQHPTEYAYVYGVDNSDWNANHPANLWDDSGKTIYDPCPAGYRVPVRNEAKPMWAASGTGWDTSEANRYIYGEHVFPTAGYIDCWGATYSNVGVRSHVWSATNRGETTAYCLYNKNKDFTNSNFMKAKAGSVRCVVE